MFRFVCPDLYFVSSDLCFPDMYFPNCIFWNISSRLYFPIRLNCIFRFVSTEVYFPSWIFRFVLFRFKLFDFYFPNGICSMFIFRLFNTLLIVFSAPTHTKTRLTKCCILDGFTRKRGAKARYMQHCPLMFGYQSSFTFEMSFNIRLTHTWPLLCGFKLYFQ